MSERDKLFEEFMNSPLETHAFINGFYTGFVEWEAPDKYTGKEKHYWRFGFLCGWTTKVTVIMYLGGRFIPA